MHQAFVPSELLQIVRRDWLCIYVCFRTRGGAIEDIEKKHRYHRPEKRHLDTGTNRHPTRTMDNLQLASPTPNIWRSHDGLSLRQSLEAPMAAKGRRYWDHEGASCFLNLH